LPAGRRESKPVQSVKPAEASSQRTIAAGDTLALPLAAKIEHRCTVGEAATLIFILGVMAWKAKRFGIKDFAQGYSEIILSSKIDISVDRSRSLFLLRERFKAGTYEFRSGTTVLQAVALAGVTDFASRK